MLEDEPKDVLTGDLKALADAKSIHNRTANRLWILAASVALFVISAKISVDGSVRFLGFMMDANSLYPISTFLLALLNIAYCSAHIQTYRMTIIFQDYLIENDAYEKKFVKTHTVSDVAHSLYTTILFRSFNMVAEVPIFIRPYFYLVMKSTADIFYISVPIIGMSVSFFKIEDQHYSLQIILYISMIISILSTLIILRISFRFTLRTFFRLKHSNTYFLG